jgi:GntR family transcriptional repressor for pyruvate dehydrogenase complex
MKFKTIDRTLMSDEIIVQIKQLIKGGNLKPGQQLPSENKMASEMNVSRGTIREALKALVHLGFVERINNRSYIAGNVMEGIYPRDIIECFKEHRNIMEMIESRKIIEPGLCKIAALRANQSDIEQIKKYYELMLKTKSVEEEFIHYDFMFHQKIAQASKNRILIDLFKVLQDRLKQNQTIIIHASKSIMPRSIIFHGKIINAIKDGNEKLAESAMLNHLLDVEKELYKIIKEDKK